MVGLLALRMQSGGGVPPRLGSFAAPALFTL